MAAPNTYGNTKVDRGDLAKARFIAIAINRAEQNVLVHGDHAADAVEGAMHYVYCECERGGWGIGRATARAASKNYDAWSAEIAAGLAARLATRRAS